MKVVGLVRENGVVRVLILEKGGAGVFIAGRSNVHIPSNGLQQRIHVSDSSIHSLLHLFRQPNHHQTIPPQSLLPLCIIDPRLIPKLPERPRLSSRHRRPHVLTIHPTLMRPLLGHRTEHLRRSPLLRTRHVLPHIWRPRPLIFDALRYMFLQPALHTTGMDRRRVDALRPVQTIDVVRHVDIRRLATPIGEFRVIGGRLVIVVGKVHRPVGVSARRSADDATRACGRGGSAREQRVFDELEEEKVAEVVGGELGFEPVARPPVGRLHHAGVADEDVDSAVGVGEDGGRGAAHAREGGVVHFYDFDPAGGGEAVGRGGEGALGFLDVARRRVHGHAGGGEGVDGGYADAGGCAGYDCGEGGEGVGKGFVVDDLLGCGSSIAGTVWLGEEGSVAGHVVLILG